jgi:hypothetical protein
LCRTLDLEQHNTHPGVWTSVEWFGSGIDYADIQKSLHYRLRLQRSYNNFQSLDKEIVRCGNESNEISLLLCGGGGIHNVRIKDVQIVVCLLNAENPFSLYGERRCGTGHAWIMHCYDWQWKPALYSGYFFSVMTSFFEGFVLMSALFVFFNRIYCVLYFNCTSFYSRWVQYLFRVIINPQRKFSCLALKSTFIISVIIFTRSCHWTLS